jgi:predicted Zn-dependent peptidase
MKNKFHRKILKNGMTLIFEKRELPVLSIALATRCGSGSEKLSEKGISHFIEHMLFKGTKKRTSEEIHKEIEDKGADHNAFTSKEITAAWMKIPSKYLEFSIEILSDLFFNSVFEKSEVEKERGAILEEIKMYHDDPLRHVLINLEEKMYKGAFGVTGLGTSESVKKLKQEDLVKRYKETFFTGNFILSVVGDADFNELIKLCEKYFKKGTGKQTKISVNKRFIDKTEKRSSLKQAHVAFGVHFPNSKSKNRYDARVFHSIFSEGASSKIYKEIREKRGLAYAVVGMLDQAKYYGEEIIYVGTMPEKLNEIKKIISEEFYKMAYIKDNEVECAKKRLIDSKIIEREDSRNTMMELLFEELSGNSGNFYDFEKNISKVTLKGVRSLSKKTKKEFCFFSLVPENTKDI